MKMSNDMSHGRKTDSMEGFLQFFQVNIHPQYSGDLYADFLSQLGGLQFGGGLFNTFSHENIETWTDNVEKAYPKFKNRLRMIGYNWMGACYAVDERTDKIVMFDIGAGDCAMIPVSFADFINVAIPLRTDICLQSEFYKQWLSCGMPPKYGNCIGYKVPLFLNGDEELSNLEDSDMDVYWTVLGQIKSQIMD